MTCELYYLLDEEDDVVYVSSFKDDITTYMQEEAMRCQRFRRSLRMFVVDVEIETDQGKETI